MKINRSGFVYGLGYWYTTSSHHAEHVGLCLLALRMIVGAVLLICSLVILAIILVVKGIVGFFVAYRPVVFYIFFWEGKGYDYDVSHGANNGIPFVPYKRWLTIRGYRVLPIYFLVPWFVFTNFVSGMDFVLGVVTHPIALKIGLVCGVLLGTCFLISLMWKMAKKSGFCTTARDYLKRRCPTVEIVD
jgi:hypothetical protein